jgi:hypothetical protein
MVQSKYQPHIGAGSTCAETPEPKRQRKFGVWYFHGPPIGFLPPQYDRNVVAQNVPRRLTPGIREKKNCHTSPRKATLWGFGDTRSHW